MMTKTNRRTTGESDSDPKPGAREEAYEIIEPSQQGFVPRASSDMTPLQVQEMHKRGDKQ